jgi:DNA polymerase-3 subunit gamma/tau
VSAGPSLYRRHRPRTFADVVGQTHVVRTLRNAVERDKVHHAYLFVGSRGTGKTSMAKILAACLNCERGGPTVDPCGVCQSCVSIANASSLDVIEMDAASNNSVDDIRELRDKVAYAPVSGGYKVYILDEAHMLSSAAWNAFLKTLEEPPPHTIFVLATTEANKVLPTVVDRCHRFDFTRPNVEEIAGVLRRVSDQEGIRVPDAALALVARHATGSFRDALGTLEQLTTYGGLGEEGIAVEDVLAVLGVADAEALFGAVDAIAAHDARAALLAVARLVDAGRDAGGLIRELEAHARELLAVQILGAVPAELRLTPERDERLASQAAQLGRQDVVRLLDLLSDALDALANGAQARIQLELALVKAAAPEVDPSTRALLLRIDRLEARLAEGAVATPPPAPIVPPTPPAAVPTSASDADVAPAPAAPERPAPEPAASQPPALESAGPQLPAAPERPALETLAPQPPTPDAAARPPSAQREWSAPLPEYTPPPGAEFDPGAFETPPPATAAARPVAPEPAPAQPSNGLPAPATVAAAARPQSAAPSAPAAAPPAAAPAPAPPAAAPAPAPPAAAPAPASPAPSPPAAAPLPAPPAAAPAPPAVAAAARAEGGVLDLAALRELWPAVIDSVRAENAMLAAALGEARPIGATAAEAVLAFPPSAAFFKRKAEGEECRRLVADALRTLAGVSLKPVYELRELQQDEPAAEEAGAPALTSDELVARFVAEFDAEELIDDDEEGSA